MKKTVTDQGGMAERLRDAREAAGLSQGQVAKLLGYHRPTISEIEAGRRRVLADEAKLFADTYGVSVDWLLTGTTQEFDEDAKVLLAARELAKMSTEDLDRLIRTIHTLRNRQGKQ